MGKRQVQAEGLYAALQPKKRDFLVAYGRIGNITSAATLAGITRQAHYNWLDEDEDYAKAFAAAKEEAADCLEAEAHRRAHDGVDEPVIYQGKLMGVWLNERGDVVTQYTAGATQIPLTVKRYSDTLLIFLLKGVRPEKYRERGPSFMAELKDKECSVTLAFGPGEDVP